MPQVLAASCLWLFASASSNRKRVAREGAGFGLAQREHPRGWQVNDSEFATHLQFPQKFVFGVATAAYQVEGGASEGGRAPSIWDTFSHSPGATVDASTGDVACDQYHLAMPDVDLMHKLHIHAYRFSISWSRLIPEGEGAVNPEGATYYNTLIDALVARGIEPYVTLYHWDMPQALETRFGGWLGPKKSVSRAFAAYARQAFELFGDRVKTWVTINEPWCVAVLGYCSGEHAPGRSSNSSYEPYIAAHNQLLAHAAAVQVYRDEFKPTQHGRIAIVLNSDWREPFRPASNRDRQAAQRALDFFLGWFADPIYFGRYPASLRATLRHRLPRFSDEERALVQGSNDFFGLNSYTCQYAVAPPPPPHTTGKRADTMNMWGPPVDERPNGGWKHGYFADDGVIKKSDPDWERSDLGNPIVPWGFRELLLYVQRRYTPRGGIVVTENGIGLREPLDFEGTQAEPQAAAADYSPPSARSIYRGVHHDPKRVRFLKAYLAALHEAGQLGADLRGYFVWSLIDNFEWRWGYTQQFGIVRFDPKRQTRTVKLSGWWYMNLAKSRGFQKPPESERYRGKQF